jgi:hypothetical protein
MHALLDTDNKTVIGVFPPDTLYEEMIKEAEGRIIIEMTLENSPAGINWTYEDGKFYPPKGNE